MLSRRRFSLLYRLVLAISVRVTIYLDGYREQLLSQRLHALTVQVSIIYYYYHYFITCAR